MDKNVSSAVKLKEVACLSFHPVYNAVKRFFCSVGTLRFISSLAPETYVLLLSNVTPNKVNRKMR